MSANDIIGIVVDNLTMALMAIISISIIFFLTYFFIYKKLLKGTKTLSIKTLIKVFLLTGYMLMVLGVTFFNRHEFYNGGVDVSLFSSYREAWNSFTVSSWQFIYLNIVMFVPFGILLPFIHERFQKATWTIGLAILFTLSIESIQRITGLGNFVVDDLFNNIVGAIIGYALSMCIISLKHKKWKRAIIHLAPLFVLLIISGSFYLYYEVKAFGNLEVKPARTVQMNEATVKSDVSLDENRQSLPVYQTKKLTKHEADQFAETFFETIQADPAHIEDISYPDLAIYRMYDEESYSLSVDFRNGAYDFMDFSQLDDGMEVGKATEKMLREHLQSFAITIPEEAIFQQLDTGYYSWTADLLRVDDQIIDGEIEVAYFHDKTIKNINHQMITYEKTTDVQVKSEQEAYEELMQGRFSYGKQEVHEIEIYDVTIQYALDSKSYYQPIYAFRSLVDGEEYTILIPAI